MSALLSAEHVVPLAAIAVLIAALTLAARRRPGAWLVSACRIMAVVLVLDELGWWAYLAEQGIRSNVAFALPLQLCDIAILVAAGALVLRWAPLVELTYFWGLAGSVQALLTPDLPQGFPNFLYFQYYVAHGGVVAAALLLTVGMRLRPRANAVVRVALITLAYAAIVGVVDMATGGNYMYLRAKPPGPTPLDLMGPWPWYLGWAALVGVLLLVVLDLPFRLTGRGRGVAAPK